MITMNLSFISKLALILILSLFTCAWSCLSNNWTLSCNEEERKGLIKFKRSLQDPYNLLSSWKGNDCCRWSGVTCHRVTGRVIELELQEIWTSIILGERAAMLPPSYEDRKFKPFAASELNTGLSSLKCLSHLDLSGIWYARITVVPEFFASMKRLRHLRLLVGGDHSCYHCHEIRPLDMYDTDLCRPLYYETEYFDDDYLHAPCCEEDSFGNLVIDDVQWLSHLQALQSLEMSGVDIRRPFEFINILHQLPSLSALQLSSCKLENFHLSHFHSTFLAQLQYLDLSSNDLYSPFPIAFANMTSLRYLDLSYNSLNSSILTWLGNLKSLTLINLSGSGIDNIGEVLSGNGSYSPFPIAFANMTSLRHLDLSYNFLNSSILMWLGNLKSLTHIDLSANGIDNIGEVLLTLLESNQQVKSLVLGSNMAGLSGPHFPYNTSKSIGDNLELLDLSGCYIQSPFPSWLVKLKKLRYLFLSDNYFAGSIPTLPQLKKLDLSSNDLDDVNLTIGRLPRLESLHLNDNMLKGNILELLLNSVNLKMLDLSSNQLEGTIPPTINKLVALESFYLNHNHLKGPIPVSLGALSNLKVFRFSDNMLEGTIPESIGQLQNLRILDVSSNHLNGSIPKTIGQLSNLVALILYNNSLDGQVSEAHFSNLSKLNFLNIGLNNLTFNIGSNWVPPFQLRYILLRSCKFETGFPEWMKTQKKASTLVLSDAHIVGQVPKWFEDMEFSLLDLSNNRITGQLLNFPPHLKYLDLSFNSISGYLPQNISKIIPFLSMLYLTNNLITGPLPASFCNLKRLLELDLSGNKFIGDIPNCWSSESPLYLINFSSNKLSGNIPKSLGQLLNLLSLHLNNNSLYGELPKDLQNCTSLVILDFGENNFFGNIPSWIGTNLTYLEILRLRDNAFYGSIPWQFCLPTELQILDLGINNLTGNIPPCLFQTKERKEYVKFSWGPPAFWTNWDKELVVEVIKGRYLEYKKNIKFLQNIDLSGNHLIGSIPSELFSLSLLVGLNLSHNSLTGNIANNIKYMKSLESLDLSNNHLSGRIPQGMSSLSALNHLNLANNNFSGQVPQGNQLQTIYVNNPSIYDGNPLLCGNPLPRKCNDAEAPQVGKTNPPKERKELITDEAILFIIAAFGYAIGFWGVILVLIFKKRWRLAYFTFADGTFNKVYVSVAVKLAKIHGLWQISA